MHALISSCRFPLHFHLFSSSVLLLKTCKAQDFEINLSQMTKTMSRINHSSSPSIVWHPFKDKEQSFTILRWPIASQPYQCIPLVCLFDLNPWTRTSNLFSPQGPLSSLACLFALSQGQLERFFFYVIIYEVTHWHTSISIKCCLQKKEIRKKVKKQQQHQWLDHSQFHDNTH